MYESGEIKLSSTIEDRSYLNQHLRPSETQFALLHFYSVRFSHPLARVFMPAVSSIHGELLRDSKGLMQRMAAGITLCTSVFRIPLPLWELGYWWTRRPSQSEIPWGQSTSRLPVISSKGRKSARCTCRHSCSLHSLTQLWGVPASASCGPFPHPGRSREMPCPETRFPGPPCEGDRGWAVPSQPQQPDGQEPAAGPGWSRGSPRLLSPHGTLTRKAEWAGL